MPLSEYKRKRDFKKTPEPGASKGRPGVSPREFVVQEHHASHLHWDFRLEWRHVLKSWAVPKGPPRRAGDRKLAVQVEDHPYDYKDFEGTIPKGQYGGGKVKIWDQGLYAPMGSFEAGMRKGHITFVLAGKKLKGEYALIRLKDKKNWLLIKARKKV